jgi:hypothetical protein
MKIISSEEFELSVRPIYNRVFQFFETQDDTMLFPSKNFNIMRFIYNDHEGLDIKPDGLMRLLANISIEMGDSFIYLSFPFTTDEFTQKELPRHFIVTIDEVINLSGDVLEARAGRLLSENKPKPKEYFCPEPLIYSPQGLWAVFVSLDHYGWLGTNKDIFAQLENEYFGLNKELERQFFDFIIGDNHLPSDWKYTIGNDREICYGWLREMISYMCRKNADINKDTDIVEAYMTML